MTVVEHIAEVLLVLSLTTNIKAVSKRHLSANMIFGHDSNYNAVQTLPTYVHVRLCRYCMNFVFLLLHPFNRHKIQHLSPCRSIV